MSQTGPEHVGTRVSDEELLAALDDAAEAEGSKSAVVRDALRTHLLEGGASEADDLAAVDLSPTAKRGYEALREAAGVGEMVEVEAAKSMLAKETQIPADSVRAMVFAPLKRAGLLGVQSHIRAAFVEVRPVTAAEMGGSDD